MRELTTPTRVALKAGRSYGQVLRDILVGKLAAEQDESGRWRVEPESAAAYVKAARGPLENKALP
jgi:hypothetical protein